MKLLEALMLVDDIECHTAQSVSPRLGRLAGHIFSRDIEALKVQMSGQLAKYCL